MLGHLHDRVGGFSSRSSNAGIVKENDLMIRGETIRYSRIPSVHVGVEVPQQEERDGSCFSETTVGKTDSFGLNKSSRNRLVSEIAHNCFHISSPSCAPSHFASRTSYLPARQKREWTSSSPPLRRRRP